MKFFLMLFLMSLGSMDSFSETTKESFIAQVVTVSGKVLHRNETNTNIKTGFIKPGERLFEGSILNTGSEGSVKLLMTDRTIVDLGPTSIFKINDFKLNHGSDRTVDISLEQGKMRTSVNQKITDEKGKFTVRTKAATMGVRGTEFIIDSPVGDNSGKASIVVAHGLVEVANTMDSKPSNGADLKGKNQMVSAGQILGISGFSAGKTASEPQKIEPQKLDKIKMNAVVVDKTFSQNVTLDSQSSTNSQSGTASSNSNEKKDGGESKSTSDNGKPGDGGKTEGKSDGKSEGKPNQMAGQIISSITADLKINANLPPMQQPLPPMPVNFNNKPFTPPIDALTAKPVPITVNFTP